MSPVGDNQGGTVKLRFAPVPGAERFFLKGGRIIKKALLLLCVLGCLALTACAVKGNALPDGMDEESVLSAGQEVASMLIDGDFDGVYALLREDVAAQTSADAISVLLGEARDGLGEPKYISDTLVTGVTDKSSEPHAIAVIYWKFDRKNVMFRVAFDTDMQLIGLEIKKKS